MRRERARASSRSTAALAGDGGLELIVTARAVLVDEEEPRPRQRLAEAKVAPDHIRLDVWDRLIVDLVTFLVERALLFHMRRVLAAEKFRG